MGSENVIQISDVGTPGAITTNVKEGGSITYDVTLGNFYDVDTLKIYANDKEVALTKSSNYAPTETGDGFQVVGTITLSDVKGDIEISSTCEERKIEITFKSSTTITETTPNANYLKGFSLDDGTTLYRALTQGGYSYKITPTELENGIIFESSSYKNGYLDFYTSDDMSNNTYFMSGDTVGDYAFNNYLDKENFNKYALMLNDANTFSQEVTVNLDGIAVAEHNVSANSGEILDVSYIGDDFKYVASNNIPSIKATLNKKDGVNYDNAKVYINDTELTKHEVEGVTYYSLDTLKMPVELYDKSKLDDDFDDYYTLKISIKGVDFSAATNFSTIKVSAENSAVDINYTHKSPYYYDGDKTVWVDASNHDFFYFRFDLQSLPEGEAIEYKFTLKKGTDSTEYDLSKLNPTYIPSEYTSVVNFTTDNNVFIQGDYNKESGEKLSSINSLRFEISNIEADTSYELILK